MELEHDFTVPVPVDQAWQVLLDIERIAPCMPGATLDSIEGDEFTGALKVKLGAMTITYKGSARIASRDETARTVTIEGMGKESRGSGTASASVEAHLTDEDGQTRVTVHTKLNVTGRPAQFGRNILAEVGGKVISRFADNLAAELAREESPAAAEPKIETPGDKAAPATESAPPQPEQAQPTSGNGEARPTGTPQPGQAGPPSDNGKTQPAAERPQPEQAKPTSGNGETRPTTDTPQPGPAEPPSDNGKTQPAADTPQPEQAKPTSGNGEAQPAAEPPQPEQAEATSGDAKRRPAAEPPQPEQAGPPADSEKTQPAAEPPQPEQAAPTSGDEKSRSAVEPQIAPAESEPGDGTPQADLGSPAEEAQPAPRDDGTPSAGVPGEPQVAPAEPVGGHSRPRYPDVRDSEQNPPGDGEATPRAPGRYRRPSEDAIDLLEFAGPSLAKRVVPVLAGVAAAWTFWWLMRRSRRR
jgi:carbon monoxide dehydrogenase subunit G